MSIKQPAMTDGLGQGMTPATPDHQAPTSPAMTDGLGQGMTPATPDHQAPSRSRSRRRRTPTPSSPLFEEAVEKKQESVRQEQMTPATPDHQAPKPQEVSEYYRQATTSPTTTRIDPSTGDEIKTKTQSFRQIMRDDVVTKAEESPFYTVVREPITQTESTKQIPSVYGPAPKRSKLDQASTWLSSELRDVERSDSAFAPVKGSAIFVGQVGVGVVKSARNVLNIFRYPDVTLDDFEKDRPKERVQELSSSIIAGVSNPLGVVDSVSYSIESAVRDKPGEVAGNILFMFGAGKVVSEVASRASRLNLNRVNLDVKGTGASWEIRQPAVALTEKQALVQRAGIQTDLKGRLVPDKVIYDTRVSTGLEPLKKSPLGIDEYYKNLAKPSGVKGTNLRLDESFAFQTYAPTETGQYVLSGTKAIGPRTQTLKTTTIRAVDRATGKEYNIPAEFLERRLLEQPTLETVGQAQRYLFSDPTAGLTTTAQNIITSLKPKTSVASATPIITPRTTQVSQFQTSPSSKNFLTPSFLITSPSDEGVVSVIESKQKQRQEERVIITPVLTTSSVSEQNVISPSRVAVKEESVISPVVVTRTRSASRVSPITQVASATDNIIKTETITDSDIKSPLLTKGVSKSQLGKPPTPPFRPPFSPLIRLPSRGSPDVLSPQRFTVKVRRGGVFGVVGVFGSVREAFQRGVDVVGDTAAASFKVKDERGRVLPVSSFSLGQRFRPSKSEEGVIVERRRFRISSPGEVREISAKGWMSQRSGGKKSGRGGFNLF